MLSGLKIGFAMTGSHCTISEVLPVMKDLTAEGAMITPIFSATVRDTDTRYGTAADLRREVIAICGSEPLTTIAEVEPIGPQKLFDLIVVAPCTGNTLAKLALGITDTPVPLACKAQLRNNRPVVIAISTNDGLGANARNLGTLLNKKNVYFVPFGQDTPKTKQTSLMAKMNLIPETIREAMNQRQLQPVLITF